MEEVIVVECYQLNAQYTVCDNIDHVLRNNDLFRLDAFLYIQPGIA